MGQVQSFPRWGATAWLGPALLLEWVALLEICAHGGRTSPAPLPSLPPGGGRSCQSSPRWKHSGGEERRGSGVNERSSRLQTGPSGGVCTEPRFLASAWEASPRPDQGGGCLQPQPVRGGAPLCWSPERCHRPPRCAARARPRKWASRTPSRIKGTCNGLKIKNVN